MSQKELDRGGTKADSLWRGKRGLGGSSNKWVGDSKGKMKSGFSIFYFWDELPDEHDANSFQKGKVCIMPLKQEICRHTYHPHSLYILNMLNVAGRAQCTLISQVSQVSKKQGNHDTSIVCLLKGQFTQKVFHILLLIATHADWFGFMRPGFKMYKKYSPWSNWVFCWLFSVIQMLVLEKLWF